LNLVHDVAYLAGALVFICWLALEDHSELCHPAFKALYLLQMVVSLHDVCFCLIQIRLSRFAIVSDRGVQPIIQVVFQLVDAVCLLVRESLSIGFYYLFSLNMLN
jgi:hypothetical protein